MHFYYLLTTNKVQDLTEENERKAQIINSLTAEVEEKKARLQEAQAKIEALERRIEDLEIDKGNGQIKESRRSII